MASELKRNGETVAMVFMVDTYAWYPNALTNGKELMRKTAELNLKLTEKYVVTKEINFLYYINQPVA